MTRIPPARTIFCGLPRARLLAALPLAGILAACQSPLDYDLRGQIGAFNTASAAQSATANRPAPDSRGLISYPSYQVAVAQRGDTVADVAARIGLPADEIARFNGMQTGDKMRQGEVLALPRRAPAGQPGSSTPGSVDIAALASQAIDTAPLTSPNPGSVTTTEIQAAPKPQPAKVQSGPEPVRHKVKRGETAYTISRLYQVPVKSLAEWNGLGSDFAVREGQYLLIPLKEQKAAAAAPAAAPVVVTEPGAGSETPVPPSASKPLPQEKVEPAAVKPAAESLPKPELPEPTRKSSAAMAYPVQGKIIKTYSKGRNDGIDIAGPAGAPVNAAEAGTVAAITKDSNNVPIVVIRHSQKLLTVYQNVGNITVNKGDSVVRGQRIASLRSGDDAYVHFEVRDGFESIDPLNYLN
ncbi:peptidoglycan DD-metalloendopeptidase family protein [Leisingera daeponensis]|uniref:peptidoglycan DD-metalloendopeptidase family protein n=1 Tax=Leisingera daeponensis TaxID=405746 RepID=UPI001C93E35B|nr:peptidoglycan DD-metalloendopeptidase family protein [Leisingera daeponensis]MBY6054881.1 peptidoglycan DD-metalloendopeptidase family protein [Leisingera daeponensis]